jgi:hypothetical protein
VVAVLAPVGADVHRVDAAPVLGNVGGVAGALLVLDGFDRVAAGPVGEVVEGAGAGLLGLLAGQAADVRLVQLGLGGGDQLGAGPGVAGDLGDVLEGPGLFLAAAISAVTVWVSFSNSASTAACSRVMS